MITEKLSGGPIITVASKDAYLFEEEEVERTLEKYDGFLSQALSDSLSPGAQANTLEQAFRYFSNDLNFQERFLFQSYSEYYREEKVHLNTLISVVMSWLVKFEVECLKVQQYFIRTGWSRLAIWERDGICDSPFFNDS